MLFKIFTLVAVVALGLSTWILSSPGHRPALTPAAAQVDLPGYYLKNAVLVDYDENGRVSIHVDAERIDQVAHSPEVTLSNVRVTYQAPNGQNWLMVGDTAHVQPGGNVIDVAGNVRLQSDGSARDGQATIRSDTMRYDVSDSTATTKSDVRIDFGVHTLTARGLVANLHERTVRLESKVNGRFHP